MTKPIESLPFPALSGLLGSVSPEAFFDQWWERAPALLRASSAGDRADFLRGDWREIARAARACNHATVEVLRSGRSRAETSEDSIDSDFGNGASVRILRAFTAWPFLQGLCRDLQWELGFKVGANIYVTPEGRQGLDIHSDSHDVLVVQMAGRKDWEVFGSPYSLPLGYRPKFVFEETSRTDHHGDGFGARAYKGQDLGPPLLTCSLSPGDLLYVPRGFVHQAVAAHETSVHVTIGIHATTWGDLLALAAAQETRAEASLRETLPPGALRVAASREFVETELRHRAGRLLDRVHGDALMLETATRFANAGPLIAHPVDADSANSGPATRPMEWKEPPSADASARYHLARGAYIGFKPQAIEVRNLHKPSEVHTFPSAFKPVFDRLLRGHLLSASDAMPLTTRSGQVFLSRLFKSGIVVTET